nr:DUF551 domain-containing protein [Klebsiella quasipneumoniae]
MTKSTITRERLHEIAEDGFLKHGESKELARMALVAMDSEPDRNPVLAYADSYRDMAKQGVESVPIWSVITDLERNIAPLYRHAQPAPVAEREPIAWLNDAYLARGVVDGEAGSEDAGPGYIPVYREAGPQPAPVVPDDVLDALQKVARIRLDLDEFDGDRRGIADCLGDAEEALIEVVNRRAAMLAAAPQSPGSEPATVPGKWIPVSERIPEDDDFVYIWPRPDFGVELHVGQYCERSHKGGGWYAQVYEQNYGIEWHPITVTHWMPLPAGPQEVNRE